MPCGCSSRANHVYTTYNHVHTTYTWHRKLAYFTLSLSVCMREREGAIFQNNFWFQIFSLKLAITMPRINLILHGINILCKYFSLMRSVWEEEERVYKYTLMSKISCINGFSRKAFQHCEKTPTSLFKKKNQPIELGQYRNNVWVFYRNLSNTYMGLQRKHGYSPTFSIPFVYFFCPSVFDPVLSLFICSQPSFLSLVLSEGIKGDMWKRIHHSVFIFILFFIFSSVAISF